jgi:hypothetical protein
MHMTSKTPTQAVNSDLIADAVHIASRAPSYHNSQPWQWVLEPGGLQLFVDPDRLVHTDTSGREALISCGAALDHLRVVMAASGWATGVERFPNPNDHKHVAAMQFTKMPFVTEGHRRRANAILSRRTDRLPFRPPADAQSLELLLRATVDEDVAVLDVLGAEARPKLAEASQLTESLRLYDSTYHAELSWWTAPFGTTDGIPESSLVSAAESDRVDVGRTFPVTSHQDRRLDVGEDRSTILVLSARDDTRRDILGCGELLSAVLLEATMVGMATCTLTHMTEVAASRDIISALTGRPYPQVLIRIGMAPVLEQTPPPTPRRPLTDVLRFRV